MNKGKEMGKGRATLKSKEVNVGGKWRCTLYYILEMMVNHGRIFKYAFR